MLNDKDLLELHATLEQDLLQDFTTSENPSRLKLEATIVVGFVATKILLPIITGFLSRALYDKYKNMQTAREAGEATEAILSAESTTVNPVSDTEIIGDMTEKLIEEGIDEVRAREIAGRTVDAVQSRFMRS